MNDGSINKNRCENFLVGYLNIMALHVCMALL